MNLRNASRLEKPHILVVDDDASIRAMLRRALEGAGCRVEMASDGVEGLARLRVNKYDLLISDNQMPKLTGLEMLKQLHAEQIFVPTIMASGNLLPGDLLEPDIPPVTTLMKPYSVIDLLALVKAMLQSAGSGSNAGIA